MLNKENTEKVNNRVIHFYKVIAKVAPILNFHTFLESLDHFYIKVIIIIFFLNHCWRVVHLIYTFGDKMLAPYCQR